LSSYPPRPTVCEIDLAALADNLRVIKRKSGKAGKVLAVVKADAYGHGAVEVSRKLENLGVDFLGVAFLEEAVELRRAAINTPIVILGGLIEGQEKAAIKYDLVPVIFSVSTAINLNREAAAQGVRCKVHVKIDTGMGRVGIRPEDVGSFFGYLKEMSALKVEGIATHLSSADDPGDGDRSLYTSLQIDRFKEAISDAEKAGFDIPLRHAANSAAILNFQESLFNMVRPGIMLYGARPSPSMKGIDDLKPVLTLKTRVMMVKEIDRGDRVSYGGTYKAPSKRKIAILPIGYADGFRRDLSGIGEVLVHGAKAPVIGNICMDMTIIDVTDIDGVQTGDDVVLIGNDKGTVISVDEVAGKLGTIPYEILCGISPRVPRTYI